MANQQIQINNIKVKEVSNTYKLSLYENPDVKIYFADSDYNIEINKQVYVKLLLMDTNKLEINILNIMNEYIHETNSINAILTYKKLWDLECILINNGNVFAKINTHWDGLNVFIPLIETTNISLPITFGRDIIYKSAKIAIGEGSATVIFKDPVPIDDYYIVRATVYFPRLLRQADVNIPVQLKRTYDLQPSYIKTAKLLQGQCRKFDKVFCRRLLYYAQSYNHYDGDIANIKDAPKLYTLSELTIDKDSNAWISVMSLWGEEVTVKICSKGKLLDFDDMEIIGSKTGYLI